LLFFHCQPFMPIYAYKCSACGFAKDALQKLSAAPLTTCPSCSKETFSKQVTAAGFQLKGSGWYVTDFREGNKTPKTDAPIVEAPKADAATAPAAAAATAPATSTPAPAATPAPASTPAAAPSAAT
jgi:putative FmdB family regulatory protein